MSANTFGQCFRVTTAGESHGPAYVAIVDGCPPQLPLNEEIIQAECDRRRPGQSDVTSSRNEPDRVRILSGVYQGKTTGTPIALMVTNDDCRSQDYQAISDRFRPGHADWVYTQKYGIRDPRGGGRASARALMMMVAAGAIAKAYLAEHFSIHIHAGLCCLGTVEARCLDWSAVAQNACAFLDPEMATEAVVQLRAAQQDGDSLGAAIMVEAEGVPCGWGAPLYQKLDAALAMALMSINAVKSVSIGDGEAVVTQRGSEHRDEMSPEGFLSNHAGGIVGGISTGQTIRARCAFKPTSSIAVPGQTIDQQQAACTISVGGRHDPCVAIRAVPIVEAMVACVLMDQYLMHRGQIGPAVPTF